MTKKWNEVKNAIENLYLAQGIPLREVRKRMEKEHQFTASPRVYKEKFKEWGWGTYSRESNGIKKSPCRTRSCPKAALSKCVQVGLRSLKDKFDWQTALAAYETDELFSLQQGVNDHTVDAATREKLDQTMSRLGSIEDAIFGLKRCIEGIEDNERQRNAPTGFAATWKKNPMTLEDALGRLLLIPLDTVVSWEKFEEHLRFCFQACPGARKVQKREYAIEDGRTRDKLLMTEEWSLFSIPGRKIEMSMVFRDKDKSSGVVCPGCSTVSDGSKGELIQCKSPACGMLFRIQEEERPTWQTSLRSSQSFDFREFVQWPSDSIVETEREEEDTPGMFKRVIIKVAIQQHAQSMADSFDPAWAISSLEPKDPFLTLRTSDNLDGLFPNNDDFSFDWDEMVSSWDEESSTTNTSTSALPASSKTRQFTQIDDTEIEIVPAVKSTSFLNCNTIWDRLQACPTVKNVEFDFDLLCKDLREKAKCSATGAVVNESDFNRIMDKHVERRQKET